MAIITGTANDDVLLGFLTNDLLQGLAGNDQLNGNDGDDTLDGGDGNDVLVGGNGNDQLLGGNGDDLLIGSAGIDALRGDAGNDIYVIDDLTEINKALLDGGVDTVVSSLTYTLGAQQENLTLTGSAAVDGTGNATANVMQGNDGNNVLSGGDGNDQLLGGIGNDQLIGGNGDDTLFGDGVDLLRGEAGNDTYVITSATEIDKTTTDAGLDIVLSTISYSLGDQQEYLVLLGDAALSATGNAGANLLIGNDGGNVLSGGDGDDILIGGQGIDQLIGGKGNDTYTVDNSGEINRTTIDDGTDTVIASASYALGTQQENLALTGSAALTGTGNSSANIIVGNDGNNVLDGGDGDDILSGGLGNDTLRTGNGDDIYVIDGNGELDKTSTDPGHDTVGANFSYTLGSQQEDLILTGSDAIDAIGNDGTNHLIGNNNGNVLDGGAGQDVLQAGAGDDQLVFDTADILVDGGTGFDTLIPGDLSMRFDELTLAHVASIEMLDMRGGYERDALLTARTVASISETDSLLVRGDSNEIIKVSGNWHADGEVTIGGVNYRQFSASGVVLGVESTTQILTDPFVSLSLSFAALAPSDGVRLATPAGAFASSQTVLGDINGDGFDDLIVGAGGTNYDTGGAYVLFGRATPFPSTLDLATLNGSDGFHLTGAQHFDYVGGSVSGAGDVNGDGFDDLLISAIGVKVNGQAPGSAYVVFGHSGSFAPDLALGSLDGSSGFRVDGFAPTAQAGRTVSAAGDVNGDGYGDFLIDAPFTSNSLGVSHLVFGKGTPFAPTLALSTLNGSNGFRFDTGAGNTAGYALSASAGDINGDGFDDMVIGAWPTQAHGVFQGGGVSYVVFGSGTAYPAHINLDALNGSNGFRVDGLVNNSGLGRDVGSAGDFNGDGYDDLLIGAPNDAPAGNFGAGSTYMLFGHAGSFGAAFDLTTLNGSNGFRIDGTSAANETGRTLAAAGDLNGDGYDDILIGAPGGNGGAILDEKIYVLFGHADGYGASMSLADLDSVGGMRIDDLPGGNFFGPELGLGGDVNGDGYADIVIGAPFSSLNGDGSGATFVIYGRDFNNTVAFEGGDGNDLLNGTAGKDALIGARGDDLLDGGAGSDALTGGAGRDVLIYDALDHRVDGGGGDDTLRVNGHGVTLDLTAVPPTRIVGIDVVDLSGDGNNLLKLNLSHLLDVSDHAALRVDGNVGDALIMTTGGWSHGANQTMGAQTYASYTHGGASLLVDLDITQLIS